jgi:predicted DNA-binding protein with PD1-like motif
MVVERPALLRELLPEASQAMLARTHSKTATALATLARTAEAAVVTMVQIPACLPRPNLRFANRSDATTVPGKLEITSLVGTLAKSSDSHMHMTVADTDGLTRGGHLMDGSLVYTTAEIAIGYLPNVRFTREKDSTYGYDELVVFPRP